MVVLWEQAPEIEETGERQRDSGDVSIAITYLGSDFNGHGESMEYDKLGCRVSEDVDSRNSRLASHGVVN